MNSHSLDLEASSSQYASITDASQTGLDITGDITIEAWVKVEQLPSTATTTFNLVSKWAATTSRAYTLSIGSDDKLSFASVDNGGGGGTDFNIFKSTSTILGGGDVGNWVHIAFVMDISTPSAVMYKNGLSVAVTDVATYVTTTNNTSAPFGIGAEWNGASYGNYFDGLIDEVRVWDDIRTVTEIADNKDKEISGASANLQGYWRLNNDYTDETSNGNDLTASGSPVFSTDVPFSGSSFIITETLSLSETTTTLRTRLFTVSESLSVSETISALKGISFTIAESLGLIESYAFLRTRLFNIAESLNVVEIKATVQKKWSNISKSTVAVVTNGVKTAVSVITNKPKS